MQSELYDARLIAGNQRGDLPERRAALRDIRQREIRMVQEVQVGGPYIAVQDTVMVGLG